MNLPAAHAPFSVPPIQPHPDQLYVVTAISNPARYLSRYRLYRNFAKHVADAGAILYTVECAFGTRPFEVTEAGNPRHIQVRTTDELWLKENLLNIGISRLPAEAKRIAVIDADLQFTRPDWAQETIQQLEHFDVVQMFSSIAYLDPSGKLLAQSQGSAFMENWMRGKPLRTSSGDVASDLAYHPNKVGADYPHPDDKPSAYIGAPGGAWAFNRDALDGIGGLMDFCVLGAGDFFMAASLIGHVADVVPPDYSADFKAQILNWQNRALRAVRKNVGCVPGSVLHSWHGPLAARHYDSREKILVSCQFSPSADLKKDAQGVLQLEDENTERSIRLRDDIRSYFSARNEDALS